MNVVKVRVAKARKAHSCMEEGCVISPGDRHVAVTTASKHEVSGVGRKWNVSRWCARHGRRLVDPELAARLTDSAVSNSELNPEG